MGLVSSDAGREGLEPVLRREYPRLAEATVLLGEVGKVVVERAKSDLGEEVQNSVWFSPGGYVRTSRETKEATRVDLNPDLMLAEFVARFFSKPVGRQVIEAHLSGQTIPRVPASSIEVLPVPAVPVDRQRTVLALDRSLANAKQQIETLEETLHAAYRDVDVVKASVDELERLGSLEHWADQLPFPLASVLWLGLSESHDAGRQFKHLLHFFEATAQFHTAVLLSALGRREDTREKLVKKLKGSPSDSKRAGFGVWIHRGHALAKIARELHGNSASRLEYQSLLGTTRDDVHELLTSSALFNLLEDAARIRNDFDGHGGYASDAQYVAHNERLLELVSDMRAMVGHCWTWFQLVRPGAGSLRPDGFHQVLEVLHGARDAFPRDPDVRLPEPLMEDRLHLLDRQNMTSIRLMPLVRLALSASIA